MRRSVRVAAMAAVATLSLVASACSGGGGSASNSGTAGTGGEITVRGCTPQEALLPANTTESCGNMVLSTISSQLVHYNVDTAAPEMDLAQSIDTTDNQNFTIKLKQDRTFHDGTPVKAKNFVDAWNYAAYAPNGQQGSSFYEPVEGFADLQCPSTDKKCATSKPKTDKLAGLKVVDDYTFTVKTTTPVSNLPVRLGYSAFAPLPDSFFKDPKAYEKNPIGAGPYKFVSQDTQNIVVQKDPSYKGQWAGHTDKITYRIYQSVDAAYADVVANNLDATDIVPTNMLVNDQWKSDAPDRNLTAKEGVIQLLAFSPVDQKLQNPTLRKAISMAINREEITKQVFMGTRAPSDSWVAPSVDGYKAGACGDTCTYNPDMAKQLFQQAGGYSGTLTLAVNGDGGHKPWADATCNSIKNTLGVNCQVIVTPDFKTLLDQMKNRELQGMFRYGWQMDYPSIEDFLTPIYQTGASSNYFNYSSKEFDNLLVQGNEAKTPAEANAKYQEAEKILAKDLPVLPLWSTTLPLIWSTNVTNVKATAFGVIDYAAIQKK
ncbi:oligopeptide transport system substrate-binding protein [Raineyella antarctica]|uniref:Oligopeptide transport system substrate-binding protein n=1 Tax=Raineyella antarctica TaxID=1577474 RepID=A0A1G6GDI7_9ACTN|nr:ABC transporter substrate-binding protein [Raineyella antarctica]SDB80040.1 oligopeptide transport system substrate-binding protein [Raineyella antarctica]